MNISVIGGSHVSREVEEEAEQVGRLIAEEGAVLICGGLGGVMQAACRGAMEHGGTTVGILPGRDKAAANPFVDIVIPTGMGEARNVIVAGAGDGVIAVGGKYGTLSEISFALKAGTPIAGVQSWNLDKITSDSSSSYEAEGAADAVRWMVGQMK